ncbi:hypothetical protein [Streptosporangium minutum]|uniref:hypothetical protein n=1 Tax=Streptosporangium minutum TaxID=569862 RepID=UPI001056A979|nr:hypothetical protein [Streptosporangium minutum]
MVCVANLHILASWRQTTDRQTTDRQTTDRQTVARTTAAPASSQNTSPLPLTHSRPPPLGRSLAQHPASGRGMGVAEVQCDVRVRLAQGHGAGGPGRSERS